jgi:hypothetical protein
MGAGTRSVAQLPNGSMVTPAVPAADTFMKFRLEIWYPLFVFICLFFLPQSLNDA